jgi:hypothetical protein
MPVEAVNEDTTFGEYANKYVAVEGWSFSELVNLDIAKKGTGTSSTCIV